MAISCSTIFVESIFCNTLCALFYFYCRIFRHFSLIGEKRPTYIYRTIWKRIVPWCISKGRSFNILNVTDTCNLWQRCAPIKRIMSDLLNGRRQFYRGDWRTWEKCFIQNSNYSISLYHLRYYYLARSIYVNGSLAWIITTHTTCFVCLTYNTEQHLYSIWILSSKLSIFCNHLNRTYSLYPATILRATDNIGGPHILGSHFAIRIYRCYIGIFRRPWHRLVRSFRWVYKRIESFNISNFQIKRWRRYKYLCH